MQKEQSQCICNIAKCLVNEAELTHLLLGATPQASDTAQLPLQSLPQVLGLLLAEVSPQLEC